MSGEYVAVAADANAPLLQPSAPGCNSVSAFVKANKLISGLFGAACFAGIVALAVVYGVSASNSNASQSPIQQVMLAAAWNGVDVSHAMSVTWVVMYGSNFSGVPPSPALSPATPINNIGNLPKNPRVYWGFNASGLRYSVGADMGNYTYNSNMTNGNIGYYTSPILLNATIGCTSIASSSTSINSKGVRAAPAVACLSPGQRFYYMVGDDANGWSQVYSSVALAAAGTPGVRLALIGDLGTTVNSAGTRDHVIANHVNPGPAPVPSGNNGSVTSAQPFTALLHIGDLSYADGTQVVWDTYGDLIQPLSSMLPWMNSVGNHEWFDFAGYSFTSYMARFRTPASQKSSGGFDATNLYYSFNTGLFHIVMLQGYCPQMSSTKTQPCLAAGTSQLNWLINDLATVDRVLTPWVVVNFHQPFMNSNTAHAIATEGLPMKNAIDDVLYQYKVDVVFSGHVHAYERCCRSYNYTCVADGPVYITIVDGGNREGLATGWVTPQPAWSIFRQASYGHGELTAVNSTHLYWAWHQNPDLAPTIADQTWVVKGVAGEVGPGITSAPTFKKDLRSQ